MPDFMPILNPSQSTSADLLTLSGSAMRLLSAAAETVNAISRRLLALPNDSLQIWLNSQPVADVAALFAAHAEAGAAINRASAITAQQLTESGTPATPAEVDVRPFSEKLADQGRQAFYDGTQFIVSNIPAAP